LFNVAPIGLQVLRARRADADADPTPQAGMHAGRQSP